MSTENSVLSLKVLGLSPLPSAGVFLTSMLSHDGHVTFSPVTSQGPVQLQREAVFKWPGQSSKVPFGPRLSTCV